jgi:hypothetical protein
VHAVASWIFDDQGGDPQRAERVIEPVEVNVP